MGGAETNKMAHATPRRQLAAFLYMMLSGPLLAAQPPGTTAVENDIRVVSWSGQLTLGSEPARTSRRIHWRRSIRSMTRCSIVSSSCGWARLSSQYSRGFALTISPIAEKAPIVSATSAAHPGLSSEAADQLRRTYGQNTIPDVSANLLHRALEKFWSPVPWMLEGAIMLEFAMSKFVEGAVIGDPFALQRGIGILSGGARAGDARCAEIGVGYHGVGAARRRLEIRPCCGTRAGRYSQIVVGRRGSGGRAHS